MAQAEFVAGIKEIAARAKEMDPVMGRILAGVAVKQQNQYYPVVGIRELRLILDRGNQYTKSTTWNGSDADRALRRMVDNLEATVYSASPSVAGANPLLWVAAVGAAWYAWKNKAKIKRAFR
jgi:hypothetical protein